VAELRKEALMPSQCWKYFNAKIIRSYKSSNSKHCSELECLASVSARTWNALASTRSQASKALASLRWNCKRLSLGHECLDFCLGLQGLSFDSEGLSRQLGMLCFFAYCSSFSCAATVNSSQRDVRVGDSMSDVALQP
jgi:hypothetical protein